MAKLNTALQQRHEVLVLVVTVELDVVEVDAVTEVNPRVVNQGADVGDVGVLQVEFLEVGQPRERRDVCDVGVG